MQAGVSRVNTEKNKICLKSEIMFFKTLQHDLIW